MKSPATRSIITIRNVLFSLLIRSDHDDIQGDDFMKKQLLLLLLLTFVLLLGGCSGKNDDTASTLSTDTETNGDAASEDTDSDNSTSENATSTDDSDEIDAEQEPEDSETPENSQEDDTKSEESSIPSDSHDPVSFTVTDPENTRNLSTKRCSFSFGAAKNGKPHSITVNNQEKFDSLGTGALAWDNKTDGKVLYLTFDCGYEYKNLTADILDTLKEKDVQAAFFCTLHYLESSSDNVQRMLDEGHIVGNHTAHHPSNCSALSREDLADEILELHNYMRNTYAYDCKYFRFPAGVYSENALDLVQSVGYRSVFWSIAHADWDPDNQPGERTSYQTLTSRLHPGAVILLHATSPDNAAILGDFIDYARSQGYEFCSLDEYDWVK